MSEYLHLPPDYERLREFRKLVNALKHYAVDGQPPKLADMAASYLWNRLWVDLALLARSTNRPGWLPPDERENFERTFGTAFGDDRLPVDLLVECGLLLPELTGGAPELAGGWFCDLFAKLNPHTAGDFKSKEVRGANKSILVRREKNVAEESAKQAQLLPKEVFYKLDGTQMNPTESHQAIMVIKSLDNCLKLPGRATGAFSASLITDANAVLDAYSTDILKQVYLWVMNNREHPATPRTTEQILREFDRYAAISS
jgi:hypothetical protein